MMKKVPIIAPLIANSNFHEWNSCQYVIRSLFFSKDALRLANRFCSAALGVCANTDQIMGTAPIASIRRI